MTKAVRTLATLKDNHKRLYDRVQEERTLALGRLTPESAFQMQAAE